MDVPIAVWERTPRNSIAISAVSIITGDTPVVEVSFGSAHSFTTGELVCLAKVGGISDDINDEWVCSYNTSTKININGATPTGTFTSGGYVFDSAETWPRNPMNLLWGPEELGNPAANTTGGPINNWAWANDKFRFRPSSDPRQLRIQYRISANAPSDTTTSLGVDGSLEFLACYTAAMFIGSRGPGPASQRLFTLACGDPTGEIGNATRGYIGQLVREHISGQQMNRVITQRYRPKRNTGPVVLY
jgi:hypothetical protein